MPQISPHDSLDEEEAGPRNRSPRKKSKRVAGTPKNLKKEGASSDLNLRDAFSTMMSAEKQTAEEVCLP